MGGGWACWCSFLFFAEHWLAHQPITPKERNQPQPPFNSIHKRNFISISFVGFHFSLPRGVGPLGAGSMALPLRSASSSFQSIPLYSIDWRKEGRSPPPLQPHSTLFLQSHLFISLLNQLFISFIINGREKEKSPWIGWRACFLFWLVAVRLLPPITNQKTTQCATNQFH